MKILQVAYREFQTTALTKGFIIGVFILPALILVSIVGIKYMVEKGSPEVKGSLAIVDLTDGAAVARRVTDRLSADQMKQDRLERIGELADKAIEDAREGSTVPDTELLTPPSLNVPDITVQTLGADADVEALKAELYDDERRERLALMVVPEDATRLDDPTGDFGAPSFFVRKDLDFEIQGDLKRALSRSIVDARLASSDLDETFVRKVMDAPSVDAKTVSEEGERDSVGELQMMIPMAFMALIMIAVMTSGGYLLTTTIEEKSSRVMEVLLSAVSPIQLLVGKVLGQMLVGLLLLTIYAGLGIGVLLFFALGGLVEPLDIVLLGVYFFIAYFMMATMMAAIGSACNDMREAQSLQTPVMLTAMIPWVLWLPIQRAPNSLFAVITSFLPPMSPFVMVLRIGGSEEIPFWQIPASIVVGIVGCIVIAWAGAKVFRVGVLMYGKPPNFSTLVRWIRMA